MITVSPTLTAVTIQEPDQMVIVSMVAVTFPMPITQLVPITVTYITTDVTAVGMQCRLHVGCSQTVRVLTTVQLK